MGSRFNSSMKMPVDFLACLWLFSLGPFTFLPNSLVATPEACTAVDPVRNVPYHRRTDGLSRPCFPEVSSQETVEQILEADPKPRKWGYSHGIHMGLGLWITNSVQIWLSYRRNTTARVRDSGLLDQ